MGVLFSSVKKEESHERLPRLKKKEELTGKGEIAESGQGPVLFLRVFALQKTHNARRESTLNHVHAVRVCSC